MIDSGNSLEFEQKWEGTLKEWRIQQQKRKQKIDQSREILTTKEIPQILLAEDDGEMRSLLTLSLRGEGYEVTEC